MSDSLGENHTHNVYLFIRMSEEDNRPPTGSPSFLGKQGQIVVENGVIGFRRGENFSDESNFHIVEVVCHVKQCASGHGKGRGTQAGYIIRVRGVMDVEDM